MHVGIFTSTSVSGTGSISPSSLPRRVVLDRPHLNVLWYWIDLTLWAIAPFVTIIVSNVAIVVRLMRFDELKGDVEEPDSQCRSRSNATCVRLKSSALSSSSSTQTTRTFAVSGRSRRVTSTTTMLLAVSVAFLVTNSPMAVSNIRGALLHFYTLNDLYALNSSSPTLRWRSACCVMILG